jgi:putative membrane protein
VYLVGVARLWEAAGTGRGIRPREVAAFGIGWLTVALALSPPLDEWSEQWIAAHMVQHELLMVVAAPLVAMGAPLIAVAWALPPRSRRRTLVAFERGPLRSLWLAITAPLTVFTMHAVALWAWHLPALYDLALEHESVHAVQHVCFLGTAALFWWGIVHGRYGRIGYGVAVMYVFATTIHSGILGALLTFSRRVWYEPYVRHHPAGLSPLEDQQLAGLLMWIPAGLVFVAGGLAFFAAWLRQSERTARRGRVRHVVPAIPLERDLLIALVALAVASAACGREAPPKGAVTAAPPPATTAVGPIPGTPDVAGRANPYANDRTAQGEGRQLFVRFNCSGCHGGHGGGGMAPSLRDADWIYGGRDDQIFSSIIEGRAHGMPSWQRHLTADQAWKLEAYIKSLGTRNEPQPPSQ